MSIPRLIDSQTERTTAATDLLLGLLALVGTWMLLSTGGAAPYRAGVWAGALGCLALASLLGVAAHGFQMSERTNRAIWKPLNLSLGLAIAFFVVGVVLDLWGAGPALIVLWVMVGAALAFFLITVFIPNTFLVFIAYEALAMLFALAGYLVLAIRGALPGAALIAAGVLVTLIAAAIQATGKVRLHLLWAFDHNVIFHIVQMIGVVLLVLGVRAGLIW
ncbi:MAG: hypothetical protein IT326_09635 [Anaerolineae bacterium]|nr:hypothetical protein [Anaerolineae bacterium]